MPPPTESTPLKRPKAEQGPTPRQNGPERRLHWAAATGHAVVLGDSGAVPQAVALGESGAEGQAVVAIVVTAS